MAEFIKIIESNKKTWLASPIVGHSKTNPIYKISLAEGLILQRCGLTYVAQLFQINELNGKIDKYRDASLQAIAQYPILQNKCKVLRSRLARMLGADESAPNISSLAALERLRWSNLYRKMHRICIDDGMPGPPSFFTRRRDGIPVPPLHKFMAGYRKLFQLKLHSKTLENSYLVMNRQIWTNVKQYLSGGGAGGDGEDPDNANCLLCGNMENTMHLMFECEQYSEKIWKGLSDALNHVLNIRLIGGITLHAYNVMYNNDIRGLDGVQNDQVLYLIQEIKRNLVYRRYIRSTRGINIRNNNTRILAHTLLVINKTIYHMGLEGRDAAFLTSLRDYYTMII